MRKPGRRTVLVEQAYIGSPLAAPALIVLDVELNLPALLERVEHTRGERRVVEEDLAAILGADEPEPAIPDHADDGACSHGNPPQREACAARAGAKATARLSMLGAGMGPG